MRKIKFIVLIVFFLLAGHTGFSNAESPALSYPDDLLTRLGISTLDIVKNRDKFKTDEIHRQWMAHVHSAIPHMNADKEKYLIKLHASMRYIKDRIDNAYRKGKLDKQAFSSRSAELMQWFQSAHQAVLSKQAYNSLFGKVDDTERSGVIDTGNELGFPIQNPETSVETVKEKLDARTISKISRFYQGHARELRDIKKIYESDSTPEVEKEQIKKDMRRIEKDLHVSYRDYCRKILTDEEFRLIFKNPENPGSTNR